MNVDLSRVVAFQPELLYVRKGCGWKVIEGWEDHYTENLTFTLDYLEVPFLMRITSTAEGFVKPVLYFGPAPAFKLDARYHYTYDDAYTDEEDVEYKGQLHGIRDVDIGFIVGGGLVFEVGKGSISTDVRYNLGLGNIDKESSESGMNNRSLSFWLGYCF